jgi:hypothetical protein
MKVLGGDVCNYTALLFLLLSSLSAVSDFLIKVSVDNGDNSKCLRHQDIPCKSLEFVSAELGRVCTGLSILVDNPELSISDVILFENCSSLQLSGKRNGSKLVCLGYGGLKFRNVTNLTSITSPSVATVLRH